MTPPTGWRSTTLGGLGEYLNGRGFRKAEWRDFGRPIIRIQNLTGSGESFNYFQGEVENRYVARPGELLVSWAATLGAYFWEGPEAVINQHIFKVESNIDRRFHKYLLDYKLADLTRHAHGSGMVHITRGRFDSVPVIVPVELGEQRRIVEILEDHLSRLDAADSYLADASLRGRVLVKAVLTTLIPDVSEYPAGWDVETVIDAGSVELGRQRHPDWHRGPNMRPYLRVANVFEDRIDSSDVMEMHWPDESFERFRLREGDILLNEGQSPELLGRPAMYRGDPPAAAFTNSLVRFKAGPKVLPEFALLVFRRHMHAGRFARESRITTNIAHLSAARLKVIEFPVPAMAEQAELVRVARARLDSLTVLDNGVARQKKRSRALRRAVLAAAFEGKLTGRHADDEVIEEMAAAR